MEYFARSTKYVRGEIKETDFPHNGSSFIGIKIPLMKIRVNLIREDCIIMVAGEFVGG